MVGYLAYSIAVHLGGRRTPGDGQAIALAVGTQFPDVVDKPLAWWLGVLPASRTLAHSIYVAVMVVCVVGLVADHLDRRSVALAFGFGYVSHLLADALYPFLQARGNNFAFMTWPLTPPVTYVRDWEPVSYLRGAIVGEALGVELLLAVVVFVLWRADGKPGLAPLRRVGARWRRRLVRG